MILSRLNGSVTPLRFATVRMTVSCVVNRRPQAGQERRRRIAAPSSLVRLSMTLLSGCLQYGQYTRSPPPVIRNLLVSTRYRKITRVQLLHIVVSHRAVRKSAMPATEPAGRRCDGRPRTTRKLLKTPACRAAAAAGAPNDLEAVASAKLTKPGTRRSSQRGTHSSCPALMLTLVSALAVMIS